MGQGEVASLEFMNSHVKVSFSKKKNRKRVANMNFEKDPHNIGRLNNFFLLDLEVLMILTTVMGTSVLSKPILC